MKFAFVFLAVSYICRHKQFTPLLMIPISLRQIALTSGISLILGSCLSSVHAQNFDVSTPLESRVNQTPANTLEVFKEAGMSPVAHVLTVPERRAVNEAFKLLPPLHQRILKDHLEGISFMDGMPNTALTSMIPAKDKKLFHITLRAAILHQTVSEWLTEKERLCFAAGKEGNQVNVYAGTLNAVVYVLLHETTHVIDGSLDLFHDLDQSFAKEFTAGVWQDRTTILNADTLLKQNRFRRGGKVYPAEATVEVYNALQKTPLISLYSTSSFSEDLAEILTVYHLSKQLKQIFKLEVVRNGKTLKTYRPLENIRVKKRLKALKLFYTQE
jgi:hypothetical protein